MEVPYLGIMKSDPEKRKFVYAISHSRWNDGFETKFTFKFNKRHVIPLGVHRVQIADQNRYLSTSQYGRPGMTNGSSGSGCAIQKIPMCSSYGTGSERLRAPTPPMQAWRISS